MSDSVWTKSFYEREGDGVGFDRVVFFSDAVFAIALTLAAVEIGIPAIEGDPTDPGVLWAGVKEHGPQIGAFLVAFAWVAIYWLANHRFTVTLRGMNPAYVRSVVLYLALIALLPIPASMLGEYWQNPLALALFALYASAVSSMEVVLILVADKGGLFVAPLSPAFRRELLLGSMSPLVTFLVSIPLAFVSIGLAVVWWFVGSVGMQLLVNRYLTADPPPDPS